MAQHVVRFGQRPQRQRFTQRQHVSGLVQQPAHERRADVAGMKNEMNGAPVGHAARGVGDATRWGATRPGWPGSGSGRRGSSRHDRRPHRGGRARPSRGRGRASADRRRATRAIAPAGHRRSIRCFPLPSVILQEIGSCCEGESREQQPVETCAPCGPAGDLDARSRGRILLGGTRFLGKRSSKSVAVDVDIIA